MIQPGRITECHWLPSSQDSFQQLCWDDEGRAVGEDDACTVLLGQAAHTDEPLVQAFHLQHVVQHPELAFTHATHDLASCALYVPVDAVRIFQAVFHGAEMPRGATVQHESLSYAGCQCLGVAVVPNLI